MKRIVRRRRFRMQAAKRAAPLGYSPTSRERQRNAPKYAPSLRVAAKKRDCFVARLTRCPGIELRLASRIHRFLASNANPFHYVRGSLTKKRILPQRSGGAEKFSLKINARGGCGHPAATVS